MAQFQPQYGYQVPILGGSPQTHNVFLQPSPQANIVQLPGNVQYIPGHSPGHVVSALPPQQYVVSPNQAYFPNTPIVPIAATLPQVQYGKIQTEPTVNYGLAVNHNNPLIIWDIFLPPSTMRSTTSQFPIYLNVSATEPPSTSMRLVCKDMPWMITIRKREGVVTVGDVYDAIYQQLQEPIVHSEWRLMGSSAQKKVAARFNQRLDLLKAMGQADDGLSRGIRRVDFVLNRVGFVGIKQDERAITDLVGDIDISNAWLLVLGERERFR